MKSTKLMVLTSLMFLVGASQAFAAESLRFQGECAVYVGGETAHRESFDLTVEDCEKSPKWKNINISLPNSKGVYTSFYAQARIHSTKNTSTMIADLSLTKKGELQSMGSAYTYGAKRGLVLSFSSVLPEEFDARVTCSGNVL